MHELKFRSFNGEILSNSHSCTGNARSVTFREHFDCTFPPGAVTAGYEAATGFDVSSATRYIAFETEMFISRDTNMHGHLGIT